MLIVLKLTFANKCENNDLQITISIQLLYISCVHYPYKVYNYSSYNTQTQSCLIGNYMFYVLPMYLQV